LEDESWCICAGALSWFGGLTSESHSLDAAGATTVSALFRMPSIVLPPRREFLADQVVRVLRREIQAGRWREWLPGERSLIKVLNVSRPTLRAALQQLVASREIKLHPRQGYEIRPGTKSRPTPPRLANREIGLICPEKIYSMPSYVVQLVDLLRAMCGEAGLHLEIFEGRRFARTDPGRLMTQLVRSHPKACWIPIMADRRMQQWFARTGTPVVIYGNLYEGVRLPGAGIDYRACIRHATAQLAAKGHRRVALVAHDLRRAGEQESVGGFHEAAADDMETTVVARPDDNVAALRRQIDGLLRVERPPTALIVCRTHHYATVATHLLAAGRRIPRDISLICRGEDPFLHFLAPTPAFYRVNLEMLARSLFRAVRRVAAGSPPAQEQQRVLPQFVPGASLGHAPARAIRP
jgi:DNA-binding LacI/PurR family transcriptional regulator